MLSILIPVYNYSVTTLVNELHQQGTVTGLEFEIIIGDDGSSDELQAENLSCESFSGVRVLKSIRNEGRSTIRNRLAENARFPWLLFLDADAKINKKDFLKNYLFYCNETHEVVIGGTAYEKDPPPNKAFYLRWLYGKWREEKQLSCRMKRPYRSFTAFNFLISASLFKIIRFNEEIKSYGHEDTLFGLELERNGIKVLHIDNPAIHKGIESAGVFMNKTREGVRNLLEIYRSKGSLISKRVRLLRFYSFFKFLGFSPIVNFLFKRVGHQIEGKLAGSSPSLYLLDIYKFMYIFSLK